jgi:hypothetical protein
VDTVNLRSALANQRESRRHGQPSLKSKVVETLEPGDGLAHTNNERAVGLQLSNTAHSLDASYVIGGLVTALVLAPRR